MSHPYRELPAGFTLAKGAHASFEDGACVMEAVAYIAGEPHSDEPVCASPVLTRIAIRLNDRFRDDERQLLAPLIPRLVNTRAPLSVDRRRSLLMVDASIREIVPMALDARGWTDLAQQLRSLDPVVDTATARAAQKVTLVVRGEARKRRDDADADDAAAAAAAAADAAAAAYAAAYAAADAYAAAAADAYAADAAYAAAYAAAAADARRKIVLASIAAFERCIEVTS